MDKKVRKISLLIVLTIVITMCPISSANAEEIAEGTAYTYNYNGSTQTFTAPIDGLYKLEVWGAQGSGTSGYSGGYGGYSCGYKILEKDSQIYICCGSTNSYNGGGSANGGGHTASGGGATHIATTNRGVLSNYNSYRSEVLIVAGGGGGAYHNDEEGRGTSGGSGGGVNGGSVTWYDGRNSSGASQSSGNAFGVGGSSYIWYGSGGGGGWYGGYGGYASGGGGSGYIGGVPTITFKGTNYSPTTSNGARGGNGMAKITYLKPSYAVSAIPNTTQWSNENIEVTVSSSGEVTKEYSIDKTNWQTSNKFLITQNGTYTFYGKSEGNNIAEVQLSITNIDKENPLFTFTFSKKPQKTAPVTINATDY